jgi:hypothetical protein
MAADEKLAKGAAARGRLIDSREQVVAGLEYAAETGEVGDVYEFP